MAPDDDFDPELLDGIDALASMEGISRSEMLRRLVADAMRRAGLSTRKPPPDDAD